MQPRNYHTADKKLLHRSSTQSQHQSVLNLISCQVVDEDQDEIRLLPKCPEAPTKPQQIVSRHNQRK